MRCSHLQDSAEECCEACQAEEQCNVWVWCGAPGGCGGGRRHRECWLKRQAPLDPLRPDTVRRGPGKRTPQSTQAHTAIIAEH